MMNLSKNFSREGRNIPGKVPEIFTQGIFGEIFKERHRQEYVLQECWSNLEGNSCLNKTISKLIYGGIPESQHG